MTLPEFYLGNRVQLHGYRFASIELESHIVNRGTTKMMLVTNGMVGVVNELTYCHDPHATAAESKCIWKYTVQFESPFSGAFVPKIPFHGELLILAHETPAHEGVQPMPKVFFTADTHFGQQRTLELSRRPFADVKEMDAELVRRWNEVVGRDDLVYHLGDFGDPAVVRLLTGSIRLLPGNYDTPEVVEKLLQCAHVSLVNTTLEAQPREAIFIPETDWGLPTLHLIHEPKDALDFGCFYLYGHIHQLQMVKRNGLNVGVDCHQFTPIDIETVKFYYDAVTKHYDENVFMSALGVVGG